MCNVSNHRGTQLQYVQASHVRQVLPLLSLMKMLSKCIQASTRKWASQLCIIGLKKKLLSQELHNYCYCIDLLVQVH